MAEETVMATFSTISYEKLLSRDSAEMSCLHSAFTQDGFAYLDLRGFSGSSNILKDIGSAFALSSKFFALDFEDKIPYNIDTVGPYKLHGYKPIATNGGVTRDTKDGVEAYAFPRDGICNPAPSGEEIGLPPTFQSQAAFLRKLLDNLHDIGINLLATLDESLGTHSLDNSLVSQHLPHKPSTSALGILRYPSLSDFSANKGQGPHTDVGSLTILFCDQPGLQTLDRHQNSWRYVEPKEGHVIINVGDSLRFMTGCKLRSNLHRVSLNPSMNTKDRYSLAYFLRPEREAVMEDDHGICYTSMWLHMKKYAIYRSTTKEQEKKDAVEMLTGRRGFMPVWDNAVS